MNLQLNRQQFGDPANIGNVLSRAEAEQLLNEWVLNDRLKLHMKQVAALMAAWAGEREQLGEKDQWRWEVAGLLHDADWDQWPDQHCRKIIAELEQRNVDPEIIHAIASHGPTHFGVDPETTMDKMLYAFDELSGLIHAYSLMRPGGYEGMDVKGVKKRFKERAFASGVNRDEVNDALNRAGKTLDELATFMIQKQAAVQ